MMFSLYTFAKNHLRSIWNLKNLFEISKNYFNENSLNILKAEEFSEFIFYFSN